MPIDPATPTDLADDCWPVDYEEMRFIVMTAPDGLGRQDFYALFWIGHERRGVGFFKKSLDTIVARARLYRSDEKVTIEDRTLAAA